MNTDSANNNDYRVEYDLLGSKKIPQDVYYGIQTQRAIENFQITGVPISHYPSLITSLAMVKKAAAQANQALKHLSDTKANAIVQACDEIIAGQWHEYFVVDMIQGGAGTSTNMNANEVIANRALEILGHPRGAYTHLHPNTDVNMSQSTNDVYPTAVRLAIILRHSELALAAQNLKHSLKQKGEEFKDVIKMGRTQLQDAVPMSLGQEFNAYATTIDEDVKLIKGLADLFKEINLGGTAIGTGINADPGYGKLAIDYLANISSVPLVQASDLVEATSDMGAFVLFSSMLKRYAIKLSKICNDLRLLSSGPLAGLNEINLPQMQPGSSIMPGKVNPVIPEAVNQVAFDVIGNDLSISMAAEAGQLQLNVMEPLIVYKVMQSIESLINASTMLSEKCITGITANREKCRDYVNNSVGIVTALNPYIGYENASRIAKTALKSGRRVIDLVLEEGLLDETQLKEILKPENMLNPSALQLK
ncbi:aspartate ammonia-lyase [Spartinivicinus poritis]|uniref:Aspartate ammonia-lyase n=1 Tax=Spartinivicinus poritis TaxID=2994640 RepID=A0ABT5UBE0_9GAMM|nr:aspartate ammonia-lyase [Spartinivicinus sp. A2-2]MDE1463699.1 aspartate ammonia-lyase [Spartinivicinus sp. A2-2]